MAAGKRPWLQFKCAAKDCQNDADMDKTFFEEAHMDGVGEGIDVTARINLCDGCYATLHGINTPTFGILGRFDLAIAGLKAVK